MLNRVYDFLDTTYNQEYWQQILTAVSFHLKATGRQPLDHPGMARYLENSVGTLRSIDAHKELFESLERINTYHPPVQTCSTGWSFHGLYTGPTSIAYLFYHLHILYPDTMFKGQSLWDWAQAYLDMSMHLRRPVPDPDHCGIASETLAYTALRAVMLEDVSIASQLCNYQALINSSDTEGSNEWLYGRAGYLYFLRLLRSVFDLHQYASTANLITRSIKQTIDRMLMAPRPWTWHGRQYLGAAHGTVGIITQMVLADNTVAPKLESPLADLLDQPFETGNFPSSLPADRDRLVQFCHGGPGFVTSLKSIVSHFPQCEAGMLSAIRNAQVDIWERGVLVKEPCLCHGASGNALAFDQLDQIEHFLSYSTAAQLDEHGWMAGAGTNDDFVGLYTGEAGRAWAFAVADGKTKPCFIGYNDL